MSRGEEREENNRKGPGGGLPEGSDDIRLKRGGGGAECVAGLEFEGKRPGE